jgi:cell division protein FtsA
MPTRLWSGKVSEMKNNMITALDIGSSFVRVLIAKTAKDNSLEVLGSSEVPSSGIEKGIVKDIEAVSECVKKPFRKQKKLPGSKP